MTLAVVAILFIPVTELFNHSIFATADSLDLMTAASLAKSEMEKTINLNYTKARLREEGDVYSPPLDEEPLTVNKGRWRMRREAVESTDPLEIRVHVYKDSDMQKPVVTLVTLVEDMMWELVKPVAEV